MPPVGTRTRARYPNQDALVDQLSTYGDDSPLDQEPPPTAPPVAPVAPPTQAPSAAPPLAPSGGGRVNPDGSIEAPEPGEPDYVAPGAPPPQPLPGNNSPIAYPGPDNGNTGVTGTAVWPTSGTNQPAYPPSAYAPIQGFDINKLNGTIPYDSPQKYSDAVRVFSRGLGAGGVQISRGNLGGMVSFAQANGFPNARAVGDDKIDFGDGNGPIDVITSDGQIWFQNGDDRFAQPGATSGAPGAAPGAPGAPGATLTTFSTPATNPVNTAFQDALVRILNEPEPSLDDPAIAARSQANHVAEQRAAERRRAAAAERSAFGGQVGGPLDSEVDNILAAQGDAEGRFDADLLSTAQQEHWDRIFGALGPALGAMGLDEQKVEFIQSLLQNDRHFVEGLSQQDRQFLQRLGFDIGSFNVDHNMQALLALLQSL